MRGLNRVIISGNVGSHISFNETGNGSAACSFHLASDRYVANGKVSAWVKINVYGDKFVAICQNRLQRGCYVLVEGELMNRDGQLKELVEVRAREVIFLSSGEAEKHLEDQEGDTHGAR